MSNSVPEGWVESSLGNIADIRFSNVDKKSDFENEEPVKLCNYMDVYSNSKITNSLPFMQATAKDREIKKFSLLKNDVIITKDSETPDDIAVSAYVSEDLKSVVCGYHLAMLRPEQSLISGEYLNHLFGLDDIQHYFYLLANGITRFGLTTDAINNAYIIYPPLPEQKKIAAILTSVDTVIEKTQAQIDKLKDLKTGMMQELLTKGIGHTEFKDSPVGRIPVEWEVKDLGDLAFKIEGGGTPPRKNPDYWGKGYPWATVKDLKSIRLSSTEESITKTGLINSSSKLVPAGTVILATRMAVGKAVVFDCDVTINQDLKAFYPKEKLNNKFLLQWYLYKSKYIASLGTGSTVKGIRVDDLKLLTIAVPPYDEQIIIANKIEGIEVLLNHKIAKIQKMTSLKKALMQDLLTGKVRVKV